MYFLIPDASSHHRSCSSFLIDSHFSYQKKLIPTFFFFLFSLLLSNIIPSTQVLLLIHFNFFSSLKFSISRSSVLSMAEKVTIMVLKVDLQCPCCYKKVKKILCKFPQIRDQIFNEKANTVTITVVCCDPEKLRDKLCCKGAKVIKSIEIKEPEKTKLPENLKQTEKHKSEELKKPDNAKEPGPIGGCCPPAFPVRTCCGPCTGGYGGGPCYFGFGVAPPQPCFEGYYGYGWHERPCRVTRCDYYFCEENPQACSIM